MGVSRNSEHEVILKRVKVRAGSAQHEVKDYAM